MAKKKYSTENPDPDALASQERLIAKSHGDHQFAYNYFDARGLELDDDELPTDIRVHERYPHYTGQGEEKTFHPTLVGLCRTVGGDVHGVQKIYLAPEGDGKADVDTAKKSGRALWPGALNGTAIYLDQPAEEMAVAEGIETGMAVRKATGLATLVAGSAGRMKVMALPPGVKKVSIWADNDKSGTGLEAAEVLGDRWLEEGVEEVAILVPEKAKNDPRKGIDFLDVYIEKGPGILKRAYYDKAVWYKMVDVDVDVDGDDDVSVQKISAPVNKDVGACGRDCKAWSVDLDTFIEEFNKNHFVVNVGSSTVIAQEIIDPLNGFKDIRLSSPTHVRLRYLNVQFKKNLGVDLWLASPDRRSYEQVVFSPGKDVPGCFNLFQNFAFQPVKGDCSLFWWHLKHVICSGKDELYQYVRKWLAHLIQHPGELPGTALVLRGQQGTGKGMFVDPVGSLLGKHFFTAYSLKHLVGNFNAHLKDVLLVHANEAIWGGNKRDEGVLKGLITDPTTPIEVKGVDVFQVKNFKRLIVASNEDWCIPIGMDDRRFLVLNISSEKKEDHNYFKELVSQMENGGLEALMYDLVNEDLDGFNVRLLPRSDNFDLKLRNASPVFLWWYQCLCDGTNSAMSDLVNLPIRNWKTTVRHSELYRAYRLWCKDNGKSPEVASVFGKMLLKFYPDHVLRKTRVKVRDSGMRAYCTVLPDLKESRLQFEKISKSGADIWPDTDVVDIEEDALWEQKEAFV